MNIYIASALTHVPRNTFLTYTEFLHKLSNFLCTKQFQVKYALVNSDPQLAEIPPNDRAKRCYEWDKKMVNEAELVIGECSFPSIGLGIELQVAAGNSTPIILLHRDFGENIAKPTRYSNPDNSNHELQIGDGRISLMARGLPTVTSTFEYSDDNDGLHKVWESLQSMKHLKLSS